MTGCAATRFENVPLEASQANVERRAIDLSHPERPVILVAISGGGSRAAALGWVVLRELSKLHYGVGAQSRSLTDDIGVVSSVSGGSVIAAHFALNGAAGLDRFAPDFLDPDNMRTLGLDAINPFTWFRLAILGEARVDIVEALFDKQLFKNKTFAELNQRGKPYLILNATDMASGEVFAFTPRRFDDICSDLDKSPISVGVGASSAVPVVISPVAFQNYSVQHCRGRPTPQWILDRLEGRFAPYVNLEEFKLARYANDLRHGNNSFRQIDYLYLLDGGLADNLAIHGLLERLHRPMQRRSRRVSIPA
jgi:NTE family protein